MNPAPASDKNRPLTLRGESILTHRLTTAAALALANAMANAQSAAAPAAGTNTTTQLPEVLVTDRQEVSGVNQVSSPKYTEPLRDIPQTITVVPQEVIQQRGATTLRDVLRNVPGISIQAGEGGVPNGDNLSVRGFNARTDTFVDGVRDFGGYSRDPFNLESVEVTKGPSSTTGGRGSTGGSVNLVSKTPKADTFYEGTLGFGTDDFKRATIDFNQSLDRGAKGGLPGAAVRFNAMWTEGDVAGRDFVDNSRWAVAPSIAFGLGSPTRFTLNWFHLEQNNLPDYGIPWVPAVTNPAAAMFPYSDDAPPVDFSNFYGLKDDFEKTVTDVVAANMEHEFNEHFSLRNHTQFGRNNRDSVVTAPRFVNANTGTAIRREFQSRDQEDIALANQTDLNLNFLTGPVEHTLVPGMEFARETSVNYGRGVFTNGTFITGTVPNSPTADLYDPNHNTTRFGPGRRTGAKADATADSAAFYAFDTMKFGEKWEVSGGLRWDYFDVDYKSTATNGVVTRFGRTDTMLSGRAGLVFKPRQNGSIYFGFGTSFNPSAEGLTLANTATAQNNVNVDPEQSQSFELGTKWNFFDQRLLVTFAIFRTDKTNVRTEDPANPNDVIVLDGQQRVDGVELGITGRFTDAWSISGGYTYLDSEVVKSRNPIEVGRELSNTPAHSLSLWTTYAFPFGLEVGGGAQYVGNRWNSTTTRRLAPDYWLFDTMLAYHVNENFTIRLNVYNLADEEYIDRVGGGHFVPGSGRATLTAEFRF